MQERLKLLRKSKKEIGFIIKDDSTGKAVYSVELKVGLQINDYPAIFRADVANNNYKIDDKLARAFIKNRVMPQNRMGVGNILKTMGLSKYDEWEIIKKTNGITSDTISLVPIDELVPRKGQRHKI